MRGRWYGIRGHRFVRPTLDVTTDVATHRLLAVLDHKPWDPEPGEPWVAAFPWPIGQERVEAIELSVAGDVALSLPPPPAAGVNVAVELPASEQREVQARQRRQQEELARTRDRLVELEEALQRAQAERDEARARGEEARNEALAARDQALAARDEALAARDEAFAARDAAIADRDAALAPPEPEPERENPVAELEDLRATLAATLVERDDLRRELEALRAEIARDREQTA